MRRVVVLLGVVHCAGCSLLFPFTSDEETADAAAPDAGSHEDAGPDGDAGSTCPPGAPSCDAETCDSPRWLPVGPDREGDTSVAANDYASEQGGDGADQVFVLRSTRSGLIRITVAAPRWEPLVYVRTGCAPPDLAFVVADQVDGGFLASLPVCVLADATYQIFVDGYLGTAGPYTLRAELEPCVGCAAGACP